MDILEQFRGASVEEKEHLLSQLIDIDLCEMGLYTLQEINSVGAISFMQNNSSPRVQLSYAKYLSSVQGQFEKALTIISTLSEENSDVDVEDLRTTSNFLKLFLGEPNIERGLAAECWEDAMLTAYTELLRILFNNKERNYRINSLTLFQKTLSLLQHSTIPQDIKESIEHHVNLYQGVLCYRDSVGGIQDTSFFQKAQKSSHIHCRIFGPIGVALCSRNQLTEEKEKEIAYDLKNFFFSYRAPELVGLLADYIYLFPTTHPQLYTLIFTPKGEGLVYTLYSHYQRIVQNNGNSDYIRGIVSSLMARRARFFAQEYLKESEGNPSFLLSTIDKASAPRIRYRNLKENKYGGQWLLDYIHKERKQIIAFFVTPAPLKEYFAVSFYNGKVQVFKAATISKLYEEFLTTQENINFKDLFVVGDYEVVELLEKEYHTVTYISNLERGCHSLLIAHKNHSDVPPIYLFSYDSEKYQMNSFDLAPIKEQIKKSFPRSSLYHRTGFLSVQEEGIKEEGAIVIIVAHGSKGKTIDFGEEQYQLSINKEHKEFLNGAKVLLLVCESAKHAHSNHKGAFDSVVTDLLNLGASSVTASTKDVKTDQFISYIDLFSHYVQDEEVYFEAGWIHCI